MSKFYQRPIFQLSLVVVAIATIVACSTPRSDNPPIHTTKPAPTPKPQVQVQPRPQVSPKPTQTQNTSNIYYGSFNEWKNDFINRNQAQGRSTVGTLVNHASLNNQVISLDGRQAEFSKMPWEYVESAVSSSRVNQGRTQLNDYPTLLSRLEEQYGVPRHIIVAIWGIESSYGAAMGSTDLVNALSSLAYDGRRRSFAENELIAMTQMIERGDASPTQFKGSWAGGMGHTQFIPSTWINYGVDGNNDGIKNPWTISDALGSTANYLASSGWVRGLDAHYEVRLPAGFNPTLIGQKLPLDTWKSYGFSSPNGEIFGGSALAELWLPAGIHGPALLTTPNFDVIKVYNNSSSYALGVSLLAKRLSGKSGLSASWPRHERPLSTYQIQSLQQVLTNRGYDTGGVDGIAGANTRRAFARWQTDNGRVPDGFISQASVTGLIH